jgi:GntR family transcriptional repressor for pyruvate dehydrogenase complex
MSAVRKLSDFRPPVRRRIHEDVAAQLRDAILDGRFPAGSKLPPERELAAEFEVNRTSIREAIKVLEGLGLVRVRQGDGATVQPVVEGSLDLLPSMIFHGGRIDGAAIGELSEVMRPLLFEMARLALERCRDDQLGQLRELRDRLADSTKDPENRGAAARDLLVALSDMTGNRVWQMLARRARALLASDPMRETRRRLRRDPARLAVLIDECLDLRAAGKSEEALAALRRAIELVGERTITTADL